ncbi:hypothetical protein K7X08_017238 [Anisodus acutangulus]|uniref:Uncharacterized protein n=1 Tax=Anisodus acutangulus TaxID=402998 RepID=A0A9Q1LQX3_9SOLA|nr:hypothetical protein K7X08_017238 [Anisodus acutangulus]
MDFREPRSPVGSIDSDTPIVRLDANILHPRALRMLGFTTKEGLELEGMTEALTTMFKDPTDYVLEAPRVRSVMKQLDRAQEVHSQVSSSSSFTTGDTGSAQTPFAMPHRQIIPRETSTPNNAAGRAPEPIRSLVKLNQSCVELPTSSSERRKWGDDCIEEEAESEEEGYAQITMDFREPRSPVGSIDSDTPIVRLDANILHPRALRMLGFTTKEGLELESMTEALTTMFKDPADYVLEAPRARSVMKQLDRAQEVHSQVSSSSSFTTGLVKLNQSCVELPTSSSERRKWGDDCVEEEGESDEEGYAQITMDFREPRSPVGSIDSDTPIVRLDANILHPRALRMLGFTTKEGLEFEGMTEALTTIFQDPADYILEAPRARTILKLPERPQEVHSHVSSSSSFTTGDTVSIHSPAATVYRPIEKLSTPTYNALGLVKLNQSCVELPTPSSERRKWGDDCVEEEAESDEEGYAQITMDFREPRSPVGSIDSDTPIVRLDANILHPRALRMLGFTTKEGLEFEGMTEALTTMFKDPADYVLDAPRARTWKLPERPQEVHSQVSSSSSFTTGDTVSIHSQ